jgi:hypothetical protein
MASLHNFHKNKHPGFFEGIGNKIKFGAEVAGAVKTIFDVGKGIYTTLGPAAGLVAALV